MTTKTTPDPLATAMRRTGLRQVGIARLLNVTERTVSRWAHGDEIPGPAALVMEIIACETDAEIAVCVRRAVQRAHGRGE